MDRRRLLVAPAVLVGVTLSQVGLASPAHAATLRYASPTGSATQTCLSTATACTIDRAVSTAGSGDEVVVAPGSYSLSTTLSRPSTVTNLNLHGVAGQPRPVITTSANIGIQLLGDGSRVADLTVVQTGSQWGLNLFAANITVERVEVRTSAQIACGLGYSGLVRDSLCVTTSSGGVALDDSWGSSGSTTAGALTLRNVTAIATGASSYGIQAKAGDFANLDINARNVIASGTLADIRATRTLNNSDSDIVLTTSNYDLTQGAGNGVTITAPGTLTNQTAAPLFAETVSYHQAVGSPTIDTGTTDSFVGTLDLDGAARKVGSAVDIGADEFVPDTTPPDVAFDRTPKHKTNKRKAVFEFHASEAVTFVCVVDTKPGKVCTSPLKLKPRKRGKHTLTVGAVDAAGNADASPASYTWKIKKHGKGNHHHGHHHHRAG